MEYCGAWWGAQAVVGYNQAILTTDARDEAGLFWTRVVRCCGKGQACLAEAIRGLRLTTVVTRRLTLSYSIGLGDIIEESCLGLFVQPDIAISDRDNNIETGQIPEDVALVPAYPRFWQAYKYTRSGHRHRIRP